MHGFAVLYTLRLVVNRRFLPAQGCLRQEFLAALAVQKLGQALTHNKLGLGHNALDQLIAARNIVNQSGDHTAAPGRLIHPALLENQTAFDSGHQMTHIVNGFRLAFFFSIRSISCTAALFITLSVLRRLRIIRRV